MTIQTMIDDIKECRIIFYKIELESHNELYIKTRDKIYLRKYLKALKKLRRLENA